MSPLIGVKTSLKLAWITVSENTENVAFFKYCNKYKYSGRSANHPQIKCLILFSNPQDTSGARMTGRSTARKNGTGAKSRQGQDSAGAVVADRGSGQAWGGTMGRSRYRVHRSIFFPSHQIPKNRI